MIKNTRVRSLFYEGHLDRDTLFNYFMFLRRIAAFLIKSRYTARWCMIISISLISSISGKMRVAQGFDSRDLFLSLPKYSKSDLRPESRMAQTLFFLRIRE